MAFFTYDQRCHPNGEFRIQEVIKFLIKIKQNFGIVDFYDRNDKIVDLSEEYLQKLLESKLPKGRFSKLGATINFFSQPPSLRDDSTLLVEIHTGTNPEKRLIDHYNFSIGNHFDLQYLDFIRDSIKLFNPFEAFVLESANEFKTQAHVRQQSIRNFERPSIIRYIHYINLNSVQVLGGLEFCLGAPAWKVQEFHQGILLQLCEEVFEPDNPQHLQVQAEVMKYFSM
jgi:hypothetical protein